MVEKRDEGGRETEERQEVESVYITANFKLTLSAVHQQRSSMLPAMASQGSLIYITVIVTNIAPTQLTGSMSWLLFVYFWISG